jgi:hypothetical protein
MGIDRECREAPFACEFPPGVVTLKLESLSDAPLLVTVTRDGGAPYRWRIAPRDRAFGTGAHFAAITALSADGPFRVLAKYPEPEAPTTRRERTLKLLAWPFLLMTFEVACVRAFCRETWRHVRGDGAVAPVSTPPPPDPVADTIVRLAMGYATWTPPVRPAPPAHQPPTIH